MDLRAPPLPPAELAGYVIGGESDARRALELYESQGAAIREAIVRLLGPEWEFSGRRILDFGCGSGRVLRQFLPEASDAEFHGCDVDEQCVAWMNEQLSPPVHVHRCDRLPPLPYQDNSFDAVWAIAVLSHLVDSWAEWLLELRRVLVPGGVLLATVMGEASSEAIAGEPWDPDRIGMTVLGAGRPWNAGGPMSLHSEWWVRARWGRAFDIVAYEPGAVCGQDAVLMRRRDSDVTPDDLRAPEPGEPREFTAIEHNLELLHCEYARLNAAHDDYAAAYHDEVRRREDVERRLQAAQAELARPVIGRLARAVRRRAR